MAKKRGRRKYSIGSELFVFAQSLPTSRWKSMRRPPDRIDRVSDARQVSILSPRRDHSLPLAWLGVRHSHRQVVV